MSRAFKDPTDGFAASYAVDLLYEEPLLLAAPALLTSLASFAPGLAPIAADDRSMSLALPPMSGPGPRWQVALAAAAVVNDELELAARQTWWWPAGRELLPRCRMALRVSDDGAEELEHRHRLEQFQRVLSGVHTAVPCLALHWRPSQQLVDPDELTATMLEDDFANPLPGAINVRFYRLETGGGADRLMDTVGLAALGLPDLQCHFRGLEPADVSRVLYSTACYLYDHGPVMKSGSTVEGPTPVDRWRCQLEDAIAAPPRPVFDLDPGFPFAAGEPEPETLATPPSRP